MFLNYKIVLFIIFSSKMINPSSTSIKAPSVTPVMTNLILQLQKIWTLNSFLITAQEFF